MEITKEYLEETREMHNTLQGIDDKIQEIKDRAVNISPSPFSERVQTSRNVDAMADRVVKYSALENLYMSVYNECLDRCVIISEGIKPIPFKEQLIVIAYYLEGESVPDICDRMHISRSTFFQLRRSALSHIAALG